MRDLYVNYYDIDHEQWLPMTDEDIAEACEMAAAMLEGHWTRGTWWNSDDQMCIEGGLGAALGLDVAEIDGMEAYERDRLVRCPVYDAVIETLNQIQDDAVFSLGELPNWNDADWRTEAEALDLLHLTAKRVLGVPV